MCLTSLGTCIKNCSIVLIIIQLLDKYTCGAIRLHPFGMHASLCSALMPMRCNFIAPSRTYLAISYCKICPIFSPTCVSSYSQITIIGLCKVWSKVIYWNRIRQDCNFDILLCMGLIHLPHLRIHKYFMDDSLVYFTRQGFPSLFANFFQKQKKSLSWKITDVSSVKYLRICKWGRWICP